MVVPAKGRRRHLASGCPLATSAAQAPRLGGAFTPTALRGTPERAAMCGPQSLRCGAELRALRQPPPLSTIDHLPAALLRTRPLHLARAQRPASAVGPLQRGSSGGRGNGGLDVAEAEGTEQGRRIRACTSARFAVISPMDRARADDQGGTPAPGSRADPPPGGWDVVSVCECAAAPPPQPVFASVQSPSPAIRLLRRSAARGFRAFSGRSSGHRDRACADGCVWLLAARRAKRGHGAVVRAGARAPGARPSREKLGWRV